jgi:nucleotide sugar dehydrogenase
MNIGIIGQGFVGSAIREGLKNFYKIRTYDIDASKCNSTHSQVCLESDIIFICLPTPMRKNGSCDTRILESAIREIDLTVYQYNRRPIVVIKSTVPPGTTKKLNEIATYCSVCFSPEFLTEANSFEDFKNQSRIIVGGQGAKKVKQMFRKPFPGIPIVVTKSETAEMVKYFTNCFLATKVTFANQMFQICNDNNIDYDKVCEYALYDTRIGKSHLAVPGPDGDLGFGGHCFPKDLAAMISFGLVNMVDTSFLEAVQEYNNKCRRFRDWEHMKGRAVSND